jgi:hypothetical protein
MDKRLMDGSTAYFGLYERFTVWSIVVLSIVSMILNSQHYIEMAEVFSSISQKYEF